MFTRVLSNETSPPCFYGFCRCFTWSDLKFWRGILKDRIRITSCGFSTARLNACGDCMSALQPPSSIPSWRICMFVQDPEQLCSSSEDQPGFGGQDAQDGKKRWNTLALKKKKKVFKSSNKVSRLRCVKVDRGSLNINTNTYTCALGEMQLLTQNMPWTCNTKYCHYRGNHSRVPYRNLLISQLLKQQLTDKVHS